MIPVHVSMFTRIDLCTPGRDPGVTGRQAATEHLFDPTARAGRDACVRPERHKKKVIPDFQECREFIISTNATSTIYIITIIIITIISQQILGLKLIEFSQDWTFLYRNKRPMQQR